MAKITIFPLVFILFSGIRPACAYDDFRYFMGVDIEEAKKQAEAEYYRQNPPVVPEPVKKEAPWPLRQRGECILEGVANRMGIQLKDAIPAPKVYFRSRTPLQAFQDAVEKVYGFRPSAFTNVYLDSENIIFVIDERDFYRHGRSPEDSLAHEYVHFLQVKYKGYTRNDDQEMLEEQAVQIQTWFRDSYVKNGEVEDPCCDVPSEQTVSSDGYHMEPAPRKGHYEEYSPDGWHVEHHFVPHCVKEVSPDGWHIENH